MMHSWLPLLLYIQQSSWRYFRPQNCEIIVMILKFRSVWEDFIASLFIKTLIYLECLVHVNLSLKFQILRVYSNIDEYNKRSNGKHKWWRSIKNGKCILVDVCTYGFFFLVNSNTWFFCRSINCEMMTNVISDTCKMFSLRSLRKRSLVLPGDITNLACSQLGC